MKIEKSFQAGTMRMRVVDDVMDHDVSELLRAEINQCIKEEQYRIALDLGGVRILHSVGIGMLLSQRKLLTQLGGNLVFTSISPELENIFKLTGVMRLMEIEKK